MQIGVEGEVLEELSVKVPGSTAVRCYAPATGESLGLINPSTPDGIDRVIGKAEAAQGEWKETSFGERRKVLKTLLKYILDHQDDIITAACLDSGKTRVDAVLGEIFVTLEKLKWTIEHGERALCTEKRPSNFLMFYKKNEVRWEPLGVVAACVSWNYPVCITSQWLKPDRFGLVHRQRHRSQELGTNRLVLCLLRLHRTRRPLRLRTLPESCPRNHLLAPHCRLSDLTPRISHLTFIGSRPVAHAVCTSAAKALTPVVVELGGKDPAVVIDDPSGRRTGESEMQRVAAIIMRGVFQSAGQNCIGIERVIATPDSYSRLLALLTPKVAALRVGNALADAEKDVDVGALISAASFERLESLIADAVAQGATLVCGGKRHAHPTWTKGHYFQPTLLADVTPSMRIAQEELFAPVALLMRAQDVDHAIDIANSTPYALASCVFGPTSTPAARAALARVTADIQAGMVAVNDFATTYAVQLPFGGIKGSGYGRFAGEEGLRGLCNTKAVSVDRWPGWISTSIPGGLDYPMKAGSWEMGKGVVEDRGRPVCLRVESDEKAASGLAFLYNANLSMRSISPFAVLANGFLFGSKDTQLPRDLSRAVVGSVRRFNGLTDLGEEDEACVQCGSLSP
ncbi:Meiotic Sister-Chromatid recombination aldehyde dehydrogenase [Taxawa tesnikishii (nom. ined.)]|nr:Meiotic Sister-Chromatid recombination aldehyde dehydrogenase [Dothideales sp. JES 119]